MPIVWNEQPQPKSHNDKVLEIVRWIAMDDGEQKTVTFTDDVLKDKGMAVCREKAEEKIREGKPLEVSNRDFPPPPLKDVYDPGDRFMPADVLKVATKSGDWTIQTVIGAGDKSVGDNCIHYTMMGENRIAGWIDVGTRTFARYTLNDDPHAVEFVDARRRLIPDDVLQVQAFRVFTDASLDYFGSFSGLPIPPEYERPLHPLELYDALKCPPNLTKARCPAVYTP